MQVKVRFRFNKSTGEVEVFEIADEGPVTSALSEHNATHDRIAGEIGALVSRAPDISEVLPGTSVLPQDFLHSQPPESNQETKDQRNRASS